jgi:hypothetical protein
MMDQKMKTWMDQYMEVEDKKEKLMDQNIE